MQHYFMRLLNITDYSLTMPSPVMTVVNNILLATLVELKHVTNLKSADLQKLCYALTASWTKGANVSSHVSSSC